MITFDKAHKIASAALEVAKGLGISVCAVVVNTSGERVVVLKMDGAFPVSDSIAYTKAFTSATLGMSTADMAGYATEGKPYHGIMNIMSGSFTTIAGGVPIKDISGKVIGAIGIGGSYDVNQDAECAKTAIETVG